MGNILAQTVSHDVEMKLLWNCPHESERIPLPTKATFLSANVKCFVYYSGFMIKDKENKRSFFILFYIICRTQIKRMLFSYFKWESYKN